MLAATATAALAGSGVGGVFNLGKVNTVDARTNLVGTTATRQLYVSNASALTSSGALSGVSSGGTGVLGQSERRIGVRALVTRVTGINYGLYATAASAGGLAGYFENTNADSAITGTALRAVSLGTVADIPGDFYAAAGEFVGATGVIGVAAPSINGGYGVVGFAPGAGGTGIQGYAPGSGGIGLFGQGANYGLYSSGDAYIGGNLVVTGTVTKPAGSFKIDHPLDPANKFLSHSFVESPDMMNIYNGNVVTDASGGATVALPDYFETLNRDPRYQLTVIGSPGDAYVAEEVSGNSFSIKTEEPGVRVSWQVTGIRRDAYALAHPIVVEEEKLRAERGRYLHPEEHGQPAELAIDAVSAPSQAADLAPQPITNGG